MQALVEKPRSRWIIPWLHAYKDLVESDAPQAGAPAAAQAAAGRRAAAALAPGGTGTQHTSYHSPNISIYV